MPRFQDKTRRHADEEKAARGDDVPPLQVGLRDRIAHFTWPWFACTMSTGAVAVVLANTPNKFLGLMTIGKIFYITNLVLFVLFTALMVTRFILVPPKFMASLVHPVEGLFHGAYWVSVSLILNGAQSYGVPNCGPWLVKALEICYWTYCSIVFLVGVGQYYIFFQSVKLDVHDAVPVWIFPIYPLLVVGTMAGTMIPSQPTDRGWYMWVGAVALQGLAWVVALLMYSLYTQRLMTAELPSPSTRPGMYVSVGPAGYTAAGLVSLGKQASIVVPASQFTELSLPDGDLIRNLGIISGLFIILFSFWFFCISTVAVLTGIRRMSFTLNWWAFIFPNAGLTLAAIQIAQALNSDGIRGVCSALTIMLVAMWLFVAASCIRAVWIGGLLWPGKDEDKTMKEIGWGRHGALPTGQPEREKERED
ncbi:hypothetical protein BU23DRAFT_582565 [Bimuria novae-zelandiae CBS 107.79]|uniref:Malic acid transport protein n=1 Tax=Bimuria novae-zelandiae CBS 107.79 TaxID=1447943 RepID=A0A6A5UYG0_9PLEO|nr:hypothetical protein BU23DRAFT_582565 [Bimuria novae-zelandiae CBS 107.79]